MSEVGRTKIVKETPYRFRIEQEGAMRVPGIVFASRSLLPDEHEDMALAQVANVATLPGIVRASYAMPDVHWGYGFPIGGVAATDIDADGVVSPGGVGFDISCGVRLLVSRELDRDRLQPRIRAVMDHLDVAIPRGVGTKGVWRLPNRGVLKQVLAGGARFAVEQGHGVARDVKRCEDGGVLEGADPAAVSDQAFERGLAQIGSLGSGNHFLEVQAVDRIYDAAVAGHMGLSEGRICVMIHTGSRGLGHQICTDHVRQMGQAMGRYGIHVPDRQLACVPVRSPEGQAYLAAMAARPTTGEPTGSCSPRRHVGCLSRKPRHPWTCCTTCRTTSPRSRCTRSTAASAPCVCIGKARPAHCRRTIPTYPPISRRSVSPC